MREKITDEKPKTQVQKVELQIRQLEIEFNNLLNIINSIRGSFYLMDSIKKDVAIKNYTHEILTNKIKGYTERLNALEKLKKEEKAFFSKKTKKESLAAELKKLSDEVISDLIDISGTRSKTLQHLKNIPEEIAKSFNENKKEAKNLRKKINSLSPLEQENYARKEFHKIADINMDGGVLARIGADKIEEKLSETKKDLDEQQKHYKNSERGIRDNLHKAKEFNDAKEYLNLYQRNLSKLSKIINEDINTLKPYMEDKEKYPDIKKYINNEVPNLKEITKKPTTPDSSELHIQRKATLSKEEVSAIKEKFKGTFKFASEKEAKASRKEKAKKLAEQEQSETKNKKP